MNNIEILENKLKLNEKTKFDWFGEKEFEAIENLIQENKELKDKNMKMAVNGGSISAIHYIEENYIQKSKVEELKEKIHNLLEDNGITRVYQLEIDKYFEDLEKGE